MRKATTILLSTILSASLFAQQPQTGEQSRREVKWVNPEIADMPGLSHHILQSKNNPRILRYADVLLLKAEAMVRSGGSLSEAVGLINQVRARARKSVTGTASVVPADLSTSELNAATVLDWIFKERRIELACEEGHRWYDLRRRHIAGEIDLKTWNFSSKRIDFAFKNDNVNFPLPEIEVIENPNLEQNPGY